MAFNVCLSAGCGTVDSGLAALTPEMDAWHGHSFDELVSSWGEPSSQLGLGEDLVAYTWASKNSDCQQTFTVRSDRIVGSSDTGCRY
jgi:hypothetical protein